MYKIARFSTEYPTTVMMLVLAILLLGYISLTRLNVDLLPELNNPRLFVDIKSGEKPPEEMEKQYVTSVEALASRQSGVQRVSSISRVGVALVTVEYSWKTDMDEALLDLQKGLANYNSSNNDAEITVTQLDPNSSPVMLVAFSHPDIDDPDDLRKTAENIIRNDLIRLEGIAAVDIVGAQTAEVEIKTDSRLLEAYGLSLDQLASKITAFNRNISGGSIVEMGRRYLIRGIGEMESLDDLRDLIIDYKSKAQITGESTDASARVPIYLRDVATVDWVLSEPENIVRVNGQRCLGLEIHKERKFNTIEAAKSARAALVDLKKSLPGYELQTIYDQSRFISASISEVEQAGVIGIILAILVLYVFLRRIGVTTVIGLAIPISVVATFNLMYFNHLTLNVMTLGGLALGAGMLVDNAIVVMENIFRHLEEGVSLREAAVLGTGQVGGAITSATLTTIVVFLPIVYLHGAAGELFKEQAWTVAFALFSSLLVAIMVMPMLVTRILKTSSAAGLSSAIRFPRYGNFLRRVVARRKLIVISTLVLVAVTGLMVPFVGSEFLPRSDQGEFYLNISLPQGSSLERTQGTAENIESIIQQDIGADVDEIYTRVGPSSSSTDEEELLQDENNAVIHVILKPDRTVTTAEAVRRVNRELALLPDVEIEFVQQQTALQQTLGTTTAPLVVQVKGEDLDLIEEYTDTIKARIAGLPGLMNVETGFEGGRPQIDVVVDRQLASYFGLTVESVASQLKDLLSGRQAGELDRQGEYSDIQIRRPKISVSELKRMALQTSSGQWLTLQEVARLEESNAPKEVERDDQSRVGKVTAQLDGKESFDKVVQRVRTAISNLHMPPRYSVNITGEEEMRSQALGNLNFALMLAVILVYMVMASQFESLRHPFVIILTLPLAGVGAVWGLLLAGIPFNIMSLIGIIFLAGIAVNDSIILVDAINQLRRSGVDLTEAIVRAGQMRIRPILMTSVTTILALLPLTIGIGEGVALRAPLAVAIIGGLITSTLLTLIVIPAVYYFLSGRVVLREEKLQQ